MPPTGSPTSQTLRYRPDIDGLRGVAVLLVVIFHAVPGNAPGGFVGVDVFFVISGFLITGIILNDQQRQRFSFANFYARRVRRIFPALIVVLLATYAAGWRYLMPDAFASLGRNLMGAAAFVSNFVLWSEVGYFDFAANAKPLLHLWSLGVEEQFYIFWPLTLWLAARTGRRSTGKVIAWGLLLASFALNLAVSGSSPSADFYLPVTRIWEILSGAVLAMSTASATPSAAPQQKRWVFSVEARGVIGFALIIWAALAFKRQMIFPGWRAAVPVIGAILVISAQHSWINRQLSRSAIVYLGLISYPLYLWHWPLLAYLRDSMPDTTDRVPEWQRLAAVALSVALAAATYHFIEKPIRFRPPRARYIVALGTTAAALAGLGAVTVLEDGFYVRLPPMIRDVFVVAAASDAGWRPSCMLGPELTASAFSDEACLDKGTGPLIFLWGDSAAATLYPGLHKLQEGSRFRLAVFAQSACPPILDLDIPGRPNCRAGNNAVLATIARVKPQVVVLHSMWLTGYDGADLERTVTAIRERVSARIEVVGPPPFWKDGLPQAYLQYYKLTSSLLPVYSRFHLDDSATVEDSLRAAAARLRIDYFSERDVLCRQDGCLTRTGDGPKDVTASDWAHLTEASSAYVAAQLLPRLVQLFEAAGH